jgi:energy-converting hydrogenase A subunit M
MTTRKHKTAIALTGAVALASGAYALGSQAGGGTASADDPSRPAVPALRAHLPGGPFGLDRIADRLGVDESDLRDALEDVRSQLPQPGDVRDDFAAELARELGVEEQEVEAALERIRDRTEREFEQRRDALVERLADRLNLDADEVREALDDVPFFGHERPAPRRMP